jgi:NTP pyrophosphatase (non-canonical NTP hydrolase)
MDKESRIELYKEAINKWGEEAQVNMLNEECGELITAVAQFKRGRTSHHDVMTELADVFIMIEQIATMMNYEDFEKELDRKLIRLRDEKLKLHASNT